MANEANVPAIRLTSDQKKIEITESRPVPYDSTMAVLHLKVRITSDLDKEPEIEVVVSLGINDVIPNAYTQMMVNAIKSGAFMPDYEGKYITDYLAETSGTVYLSVDNGIICATDWQFDTLSYADKLGVWQDANH